MTQKYAVRLRNFEVTTKGSEVQQHIVEDSETFTQSAIGLPHNDGESSTKVLGINWDTNNDRFSFDLSKVVEFAASSPPTKRSLLKIAAKIFDPLGCLSVYTINLRFYSSNCAVQSFLGTKSYKVTL